MFLIVVTSGGYMGYLLYNSNLENEKENELAIDENMIDEPELICIDEDGDGYGENCDLGADCNDEDANQNVECIKSLESTLALKVVNPKEKYEVGEQFEVLVSVEDVPSMLLDTLEFRLDYNNSIVKYVKSEVVKSTYTALELEPKENLIRIDFAIPDGIQNMDEVVKLKFEAVKDGLSDIRVSTDTRIGVEYKLKGGSVGIVVGTGVAVDPTTTVTPE